MFKQFDADENGIIDRVELAQVLQRLDAGTWTDTKVKELMDAVDVNADGRIQYEEFVHWMVGTGKDRQAVYYAGGPLDMEAATALLKTLTPEDMAALASTSDPAEQLPARMMLEHVGDKDFSWKNAQKSLRDGKQFIKEILELEGANFFTKGSLERLDAIGSEQKIILDVKALTEKDQAAFKMAVYIEAVVITARRNLFPDEEPPKKPPKEPPAWPIKIDKMELMGAISDAVAFKKTPLIVCNEKASIIDTFFSYQSFQQIDAKWVMGQVQIKKTMDQDQMKEELRTKLVSALKWGKPIQIAMSSSAVMFKEKYCCPDQFPDSLFKNELWFQKEIHGKVVRPDDLHDWVGAFPGRMKDESSYSIITTDFNLESALEFLPNALPYFEDLAIIEIDPSTID